MSHVPYTDTVVSTLSGLVREMRPRQWYKQGVLMLGIVFSRNLFDPVAFGRVLVAMAAFTAVAGATYVFNDVSDVEEDRKHPRKRFRPIASGQVSIPTAVAFATGLVVAGLWTASLLDPLLALVLVAYLVQNALYSAYLKGVVLVDVILVAVGFVLRAVAGVVAIDAYLSPWLVVCTFLLALVLALGKRRHEFETVDDAAATRATLGNYTREELDQLLVVTTATLLMAYSLYTFFRADRTMMLSLPFAFFGVFRYHHIVHSTDVGNQPETLFTDRPMMLNAVLWSAVAIAVLYDVPGALLGVIP